MSLFARGYIAGCVWMFFSAGPIRAQLQQENGMPVADDARGSGLGRAPEVTGVGPKHSRGELVHL
jgi:hypothetical protein